MKTRVFMLVLAVILIVDLLPSNGQDKRAEVWTRIWQMGETIMELKDGTTITRKDLSRFLADHEKWFNTNGKEGHRLDLSGGNFQKLDLRGAKLWRANLSQARFTMVDLREADLSWADLSGATLLSANLSQAKLPGANLRQANLTMALLTQTHLSSANLSQAILTGVDLSRAIMRETDLTGANLFGADLKSLWFESKPGTLPRISDIAWAQNLELLTFSSSPHALAELREAFKKMGLREQERKITYAIMHTKRLQSQERGLFDKLEAALNFILFEVTCNYGMSPGRPLSVLLLSIFVFLIPYGFFLRRSGKDGIWSVWLPDRVRTDLGEEKAMRLPPPWISPPLVCFLL